MICLCGLAAFSLLLGASAPAGASFIENRGQVHEDVLFYAPGSVGTVFLTREAVVLDLHDGRESRDGGEARIGERVGGDGSSSRRGCAVWIRFTEGAASGGPEARGEPSARHGFFLRKDPGAWRAGVPSFAEVAYRDLWPGVDLVLREDDGRIRFEFVSVAGGDPPVGRLSYEGSEGVQTREDGSAVLSTSFGSFVAFQRGDEGGGEGFLLAPTRTPGSPRDPGHDKDNPDALLWSTFLGGGGWDGLESVLTAVDGEGNIVVAGDTRSPDFPTTPGAYDESYNGGVQDIFVSKLSASGSDLIWSTFLGGEDDDAVNSLIVDGAGNPVITGKTRSSDFPTTPGAYEETFTGGFDDAFVTKLSSDGSALAWSTFLAGANYEEGIGLALDSSENVVVVGSTNSDDFPTSAGAYDETCGNCDTGQDGFVTKLSAAGSDLVWSTFLGGGDASLPGRDFCFAAALDSAGNVVVTGRTEADDFPTSPGAYDESYNGDPYDVFVSKLDDTGSSLLWSSFLGGGEGLGDDQPALRGALALDDSGNPVVAGWTNSTDFPTTPGAHDESYEGANDGFVTKFLSSGSDLLWSTYLGGENTDNIQSLRVDSAGNAVVSGETLSCDFPVTPDGYDTHNQPADVFLTVLSSTDSGLLWSTFLGGSGSERGSGLAVDAADNAIVAGRTSSTDFPTTEGAHDESFNGGIDVFVSKLDMGDLLAADQERSRDGRIVLRGDCPPSGAPGLSEHPFYGLHPNRPNPVDHLTVFRYELARASHVTLSIYDVSGRLVKTLIDGSMNGVGAHQIAWDGRDARGRRVASGIYLYRLRAGNHEETRRLVVLR